MATGDAVDEGIGADKDDGGEEEVDHGHEESVAARVVSQTGASVNEGGVVAPSHLGQHPRDNGVRPYPSDYTKHRRRMHEHFVLEWITDGEIPLETHGAQIEGDSRNADEVDAGEKVALDGRGEPEGV